MRAALVMPHPITPSNSGDRLRTRNLLRSLPAEGVEPVCLAPDYSLGSSRVLSQSSQQDAHELTLRPFEGRLERALWLGEVVARRIADPFAASHCIQGRSWQEKADLAAYDVIDIQHSFSSLNLPQGVPTVLTIHNVLANKQLASWSRLKRRIAMVYEKQNIDTASLIVVFSESERTLLHSAYKVDSNRVRVIPIGHPYLEHEASKFHPPRPSLSTAIFIGSMDYQPNLEAALLLVRWWPEIRRRTSLTRLLLVGRGANSIEIPPSYEGSLRIHSDVESVQPYLAQSDVSLLPMSHGGGQRMKALELMAARIPIVATGTAVEGLGLVERRDYVRVELSSSSLVEGVMRAEDLALRRSLVDSAYRSWSQHFSVETMGREMASAYRAAIEIASVQ